MNNDSIIHICFVILLVACIFVPLFTKLGFSSVLAYLVGGVLAGPEGFNWLDMGASLFHVGEFGVVILLFLIGLELRPQKLWKLKYQVLGMGGTQVLAGTVVLGTLFYFLDYSILSALVAGFGCSLSSTAIAMRLFNEQSLDKDPSGQAGFTVLLFQDLAVIPFLSLLPLLAVSPTAAEPAKGGLFLKISGILVIIVIAKLAMRKIFRVIALTRLREVFTAFSLLIVVGMALAMESIQLSASLGAFVAGVLLADSEYRHEIESHLEPFKGLLLGVFFLSVGASLPLKVVSESFFPFLYTLISILVIKVGMLFVVAKVFKLNLNSSILFALYLSQIGEFAFVLFSTSEKLGLLSGSQSAVLNASIASSMMMTSLFSVLYIKVISPRLSIKLPDSEEPKNDMEHESSPVIVAGFGRFGQIAARMLMLHKVPVTLIDRSPETIERVRKFGYKAFYGDALRQDLLESAGISKAKCFIVAIDEVTQVNTLVAMLKKHYPHLKIFARAYDMIHAYDLIELGVHGFERETFDAAVALSKEALACLGHSPYQTQRASIWFKNYDIQLVHKLLPFRNDTTSMASNASQIRKEIETLFEQDHLEVAQANPGKDW